MPNICYLSKYLEICILNSHSSKAVLQNANFKIYIYIFQWVKNLPEIQETWEMWVQSLGQEDPLEEENGNSLQYSCLKYPMDRGPCWATVQRVTKSQTWLSDYSCTHIYALHMHICVYMYTYICMCICVCVFIYIAKSLLNILGTKHTESWF